jgi:tRNA nucleotidyltransferase (CCA-adding enzyme)
MDIILTHENADFDAIAALLAASKLYPGAKPVLPEQINRNAALFVSSYKDQLPFVRQREIRRNKLNRVVLVDTQRLPQIKGVGATTLTHIIDHHPLARELSPHHTFVTEAVGAVTTYLVEQLRQRDIPLTSIEATLLMLGVYEDTGSLTYGTTTSRDIQAAAWLLDQRARLDIVRRFLAVPLNDEQRALYEALLAAAEIRKLEGYSIAICLAATDHHIPEISSVAHRLRDALEVSALFVLVQMPDYLQLIARSTEEFIDVGQIARLLGGGGHGRAAAGVIHDRETEELVDFLWRELAARVGTAARVADFMSYGVRTVEASAVLKNVVQQLRRIGHEGFPVVENKKVVGLLSRRDLDRATEHGLVELTVRQIMNAGAVTVNPEDPIGLVEQKMRETGWGQVPVVDRNDRILGIITRTDLIRYWSQSQLRPHDSETILPGDQIERTFGHAVTCLMQAIAAHAQNQQLKSYLVGGIVRDLLLNRPNLDMDIVIEGDAIEFAQGLRAKLGGELHKHYAFGTANWHPGQTAAAGLGVPPEQLPAHVDFATARYEFYEHPTALPTVYAGSIKLDLVRRDFTMNTLAIQLSPASDFGRVVDYYGGLRDLREGVIRVLHSLSFIDDPTRIIRAIRFASRLGFTIEQRTLDLMDTALPMLARVTGERVRNELEIILEEPEPEIPVRWLAERGVLKAIHPGFVVDEQTLIHLRNARTIEKPWRFQAQDMTELNWHILAAGVPQDQLASWAIRMLFSAKRTKSFQRMHHFWSNTKDVTVNNLRPSQIVDLCASLGETALLTIWLLTDQPSLRDAVKRHWTEWRLVRPAADGHRLRAMGIKPGPCYNVVLRRLRDAWLDGEIQSEAQEAGLLRKLLDDDRICD